jgi:hypothetical protein
LTTILPEYAVPVPRGEGMPQVQLHSRSGRAIFARAALCAGLAAAAVCASSAVRAGDDDDGGASVLGTIMKSMGFKDPDATYDGIDYNERSPLVVPPTRDLPPPVNAEAVPAPNWPKDQDMQRRAKAKSEAKRVTPHPDYVSDSSRPLRPNELDPPGAPRVSSSGDGGSTANSSMADPRDRGAKKSLFSGIFSKKEEYATFTGEPPRSALTDPPPGYLTPSPDQPYGVGQAPASYKVKTLGERVEPTR